MAAARRRLEEAERAVAAHEAELKSADEKLGKTDKMRRSLDDNVEYRRSVAAADALKALIDERLEAQRGLGDRAQLLAERGAAQVEVQRLRDGQNRGRGQMTALGDQIDKCKRELKDANFKSIDERYRTANIELRTTEMANDDLNKYHAALDKALMTFHAAKMAEINKVVKELWQKTYRRRGLAGGADGGGEPFGGGGLMRRFNLPPHHPYPRLQSGHRPHRDRVGRGVHHRAVVQLPRCDEEPGRGAGHARPLQARVSPR